MSKIDPNKPSTWPAGWHQCSQCNFGSKNRGDVVRHLRQVHGKTVK